MFEVRLRNSKFEFISEFVVESGSDPFELASGKVLEN